MKLKYCMVAYSVYSSDSRVRREAEALVRRGNISVDVICLRNRDNYTPYRLDGVNVFPLILSRYRGGSRLKYILSYLKFCLFAFIRLSRLYITNRYQVIHIHTIPDFAVFTALLPKIFGTRVILDIHDPMPEGFMVKYNLSYSHLLIRLLRWQEVISARFADGILCVSEQHKAVFVAHGIPGSKITILQNLPDERLFARNSARVRRRDRFELVYHGTIAKRLGIDIAIRAVEIVRSEIPGVVLNIYGCGEFLPDLCMLVRTLGISKNVRLSGKFHPLHEIPSLVENAHVGIVSNRKNLITDLMLPVKLLEYVALGVPVIAPRLNTILYYFNEDMVKFFDPGDHHDLARAILEIYYKPDGADRLVENAFTFFDRFNWQGEQEKLFKLIDRLTKT